jgi:iron complex transport system ATP-binding protein
MLEVKNVSAGYDNRQVLYDISFGLRAGECLSIIGPNGCGKTTLLKCIADLIEFDGKITVSGTDLRSLCRREIAEKVAVLSQTNSMYFPYSVYDTVMLGRFAHIKPGLFGGSLTKDDIAAVEESLNAAEIFELRERQINTLSGGQLQRVFLARVLAQNPQIILLDEPTNHLDLKHQIELVDYIKSWVKGDKNRAVIGVFHDMNIALRLSEKVMLMDNGKISRIGRFCDVANKEYLKKLFGIDVALYMSQNMKMWNDLYYEKRS